MSDLYTDDDVKVASRAIARRNMPNASTKLIDQLCDMGEWDDAARWVLDAVASAIAARALRQAAAWMQTGIGEHYSPDMDHSQLIREAKARRRWLRARADEIERT
jgi:hypothetical protein